ncbi:hypothetical protein [Alkalicoccus urumqiensis]|nr:hypothetical protein [Alkalicoccus urumqiensis]
MKKVEQARSADSGCGWSFQRLPQPFLYCLPGRVERLPAASDRGKEAPLS